MQENITGPLKGLDAAVGVVASRFLPSSLPGYRTAYRALMRIRDALSICESTGVAAQIVNKSKAGLESLLRTRFAAVEAQALALKILNLFLAGYHLRARDTALISHPFGIVIDPSNVCQLSCPGCVHSQNSELVTQFDWPNATMAEPLLTRLLKLYGPTAIGVYFCNYGEPLLNLKTPRLIRMAKTYLASTALSTSMSVQRFDAEAYVRSGLDLMIISIDGATQAVYERFRRGGNLELVLENLAGLVEAKRQLGSRTPVLSWNFLAFEHNAHEIPVAETMARKLGMNVFRVVRPFDVSWDDPQIRPADVKPSVKRLDWTSISNPGENWNPFPHDLEAEAIGAVFQKGFEVTSSSRRPAASGHTCHWLYKNIVMDASGRVLPCCGAPRRDAKLTFGSFDRQTSDPFNCSRHRQARAYFAGQRSIEHEALQCHDCEWDQIAVNVGGPEIRRYFRAADPWFFDRKSIELLAE
jgi:MoaA/NifB/PqqE/SkfB family radical SAM enzyme